MGVTASILRQAVSHQSECADSMPQKNITDLYSFLFCLWQAL